MIATVERTTTGEIDVRGFIQANYTPYDVGAGTPSSITAHCARR